MISALILAAGQSKRMGRPKMSLPWGESTVLAHVLAVFKAAGIDDALVVTGGDRESVEAIALQCGARVAFNPRYADDDMLTSLQVGLLGLGAEIEAVFIALGDQPQVLESVVRRLVDEYRRAPTELIVPSYEMKRGHPWLVARALWDDILAMSSPETPRDFLRKHAHQIRYVTVDTPTILADLDTPDDYLKSRV